MKKSSVFRIISAMAVIAICLVLLSSCSIIGITDSSDSNESEQVLYGSPFKHYYANLTDIEKKAYDKILSEVYEMPEEIVIPDIDASQLDNVFTALLLDNPDLFFVGRNATLRTYFLVTTCSLDYIIEKEDYASYKAEIDKACDEIIASLTNPEDEWQSELEIHDYIIKNCEYLHTKGNLICSSVYGSLVNRKAACEGYSKAAKILFDRLGIESALVSGVSYDESGEIGAHMWNAVNINGDYYYLDLTWDDPVSSDGENVNLYTYFNVTQDVIKENYSDFSLEFSCTETKENYYVKTGRFFETYSSLIHEKMAALIAREIDKGSAEIEIRFGSEKELEKAAEALIENGGIYSVLSAAREQSNTKFSTKNLNYYIDEELCILTLVPSR